MRQRFNFGFSVLFVGAQSQSQSICEHTPSICDGTFTGTGLSLSYQGLTGTLPTQLFQYTQLTTLQLDGNQLSGTLPTEMALLMQLTDLRVGNRLSGTVPTEIGLLTQLSILYLHHNGR